MIRAARKLRQVSDTRWEILSTDGTTTYHIEADLDAMELHCDCKAGQVGAQCWHKGRVVSALARAHRPSRLRPVPSAPKPEPEPSKIVILPWLSVWQEKQEEKR